MRSRQIGWKSSPNQIGENKKYVKPPPSPETKSQV